MYNTARLEYIFRKGKNDSPSKEVFEKIKTEKDLTDNEKLLDRQYPIEFKIKSLDNNVSVIKKRIDNVSKTLESKLIELRDNLISCKLNVQESLLAERKLIGESYTAVIPLDKDNVLNNTTATIIDGIVFGSGYTESTKDVEKLTLDSLYLKGESDTEFSFLNENTLTFSKNYYNSYQQIKVIIPVIEQNGLLHMSFNKVETISVLNSSGYELMDKVITNVINIPITSDNNSFSIRIHNNEASTLDIKELYITKQIYNTKTLYESKAFKVNQTLTYLTVHTCDNYTDKNVNMKYEISINNKSYREFRPNNKLKNNYTPSIISTNKNNYRATIKLLNPVLDNGFYKFRTEDLVHSYTYNRGFSWKLGEDLISLEGFLEPSSKHYILDENNNPITLGLKEYMKDTLLLTDTKDSYYTLYIVNKNKFNIILNDILEFEINDVLINKTLNGSTYTLNEGIYTLKINRDLWKEFIDLDNYKIYSISDDYVTILNTTTGEKILTDIYYNPLENLNTSMYLQLFDKDCEIFLKEEVLKKKYDSSNVEYLYKKDNYPIYIVGEDLSIPVDTIQLRITMDSIDKETCPYVSNITVRGI